MTDIREFIEARLAERERLLCDMAAQLANGGDNMRGGWNLWGDFGNAVNRLVNLHELADDIGAKRDILARIADAQSASTAEDTIEIDWYVARDLLRLLAHPFRSHPDYDPAWRIEP